jgi:hypothetical protein
MALMKHAAPRAARFGAALSLKIGLMLVALAFAPTPGHAQNSDNMVLENDIKDTTEQIDKAVEDERRSHAICVQLNGQNFYYKRQKKVVTIDAWSAFVNGTNHSADEKSAAIQRAKDMAAAQLRTCSGKTSKIAALQTRLKELEAKLAEARKNKRPPVREPTKLWIEVDSIKHEVDIASGQNSGQASMDTPRRKGSTIEVTGNVDYSLPEGYWLEVQVDRSPGGTTSLTTCVDAVCPARFAVPPDGVGGIIFIAIVHFPGGRAASVQIGAGSVVP